MNIVTWTIVGNTRDIVTWTIVGNTRECHTPSALHFLVIFKVGAILLPKRLQLSFLSIFPYFALRVNVSYYTNKAY